MKLQYCGNMQLVWIGHSSTCSICNSPSLVKSSEGGSSLVVCYWFAGNVKCTDYMFVVDPNIIFVLYSRGTWAMVKVVLWYIYSCQSVTSWDTNKMNSWDFASFTTCSFKEHILQSCKPSYSIWFIPSQYKLSVCIKVRFTYLQKQCFHQGAKANKLLSTT